MKINNKSCELFRNKKIRRLYCMDILVGIIAGIGSFKNLSSDFYCSSMLILIAGLLIGNLTIIIRSRNKFYTISDKNLITFTIILIFTKIVSFTLTKNIGIVFMVKFFSVIAIYIFILFTYNFKWCKTINFRIIKRFYIVLVCIYLLVVLILGHNDITYFLVQAVINFSISPRLMLSILILILYTFLIDLFLPYLVINWISKNISVDN